jgi:hypothetical protein
MLLVWPLLIFVVAIFKTCVCYVRDVAVTEFIILMHQNANLFPHFSTSNPVMMILRVILTLIILVNYTIHTICPADNATAGSLGRRRASQLRFGFVAVSAGHIVCSKKVIQTPRTYLLYFQIM